MNLSRGQGKGNQGTYDQDKQNEMIHRRAVKDIDFILAHIHELDLT